MANDNGNFEKIMLYGGALLLGYYILKSQGLIKEEVPTSTATSPECPRGRKYTRGYFSECDPNYVDTGILTPECTCLSSQ